MTHGKSLKLLKKSAFKTLRLGLLSIMQGKSLKLLKKSAFKTLRLSYCSAPKISLYSSSYFWFANSSIDCVWAAFFFLAAKAKPEPSKADPPKTVRPAKPATTPVCGKVG